LVCCLSIQRRASWFWHFGQWRLPHDRDRHSPCWQSGHCTYNSPESGVRQSWDWRDREVPEYDAGSVHVQVNGRHRNASDYGWRLFFNVTVSDNYLHGVLGSTDIHMGGCLLDSLHGTFCIGEQPSGVAVLCPKNSKCI
jgi:hypothetical protein